MDEAIVHKREREKEAAPIVVEFAPLITLALMPSKAALAAESRSCARSFAIAASNKPSKLQLGASFHKTADLTVGQLAAVASAVCNETEGQRKRAINSYALLLFVSSAGLE